MSVSKKTVFVSDSHENFTNSMTTWLECAHSTQIVLHVIRGLAVPSPTEESNYELSSCSSPKGKCGHDYSLVFEESEHKIVRSGVPPSSTVHPLTFKCHKTNYYLYYITFAH